MIDPPTSTDRLVTRGIDSGSRCRSGPEAHWRRLLDRRTMHEPSRIAQAPKEHGAGERRRGPTDPERCVHDDSAEYVGVAVRRPWEGDRVGQGTPREAMPVRSRLPVATRATDRPSLPRASRPVPDRAWSSGHQKEPRERAVPGRRTARGRGGDPAGGAIRRRSTRSSRPRAPSRPRTPHAPRANRRNCLRPGRPTSRSRTVRAPRATPRGAIATVKGMR